MRIVSLFALVLALPLFGDTVQLIREGIALHDQGRYDEAIAKYNAALAEDPSNELASYELAMSLLAKGDAAKCVAILEPLAARKRPYQAQLLVTLGNCYDGTGDAKRAIDTYRKGLKINPDEPQLLYNLALTLTNRGDFDEARRLMKKELALKPGHPSGQFLLATIFDQQSFRIPAALTLLRFLSLEPAGVRAKTAAARAVVLLNAGVEVKDQGHVNLTIDTNARKEEGDYGALEMMAPLAGGAAALPENEKKSEFERTLGQLTTFLAMVSEGDARSRDYTATQVVPFFRKLAGAKLLEAFVADAISSLGLAGGDERRLAHAGQMEAYRRVMSGGAQ